MRKLKSSLILIILIGAVLRIFHLGNFSLCMDEGYTFNDISKPTITQTISYIKANENSPPLYYILMRYWLGLGDSEFMLRLFSALFGILSIYGIYKLGKILINENVGLISAFLLAISPMHIYQSQMARMYALCNFLVLMAFYFYIRLLQKNDFVSWIGWLIMAILAVYTHYFAFFIILTGTVFIALYYNKYRHLYRNWFLGIAIIILIYLFWIPAFCKHIVSSPQLFLTDKLLFYRLVELPKIFYTFSVGFSTFDASGYSTATLVSDIISHLWIIIPTVFIFSLLIALTLTDFRKAAEPIIWLLLFGFFPILVTFVTNFALNTSLFRPRYLVMFSPFYYILAAIGITRFKKTIYRIAAITLIILLCGFSLYNYYFNKQYQPSADWRAAANYIELHDRSNDLVLMCFYFHAAAGDPLNYYKHSFKKVNAYDFVNPIKDNEDLFDEGMRKIVKDYNRIWFCRAFYSSNDPANRVMNWLKSHYSNFNLVQFHKLDFYLFSS